MVTISCPNCHKAYEVNNDVIGMNVECEACHTIFQAVDSSASPSVRTSAVVSKHRLDKKWIAVCAVIGVMMIMQISTLIMMFSRSSVTANTPVPITGANPTQTETPSELLLKYTELGETAYVEALLKQNPTLDVDRPRLKTGSTALYTACRLGYVDIAKLLLRRKANPNDNGQQGGFTPLTIAAFSGQLASVKLLLASGVDIESRDHNAKTALYAAAINNKSDVVRFLCESDARVNIQGEKGWTPLTGAASEGCIDSVKALVKYGKGIDLEMKNGSNNTALFVAVANNKPDVVRFLCEAGSKVNIYGGNNWTPLTYAAFEGFTEVVQALVKYGKEIDLEMCDCSNMWGSGTPLYRAAEKNHQAIIDVLCKAGADLKARGGPTHHLKTPIEIAEEKGYNDAVRLLAAFEGRQTQERQNVAVSCREKEARQQEQERAEIAARLLAQRLINEGANGQQTSSPQPNSNWQRITDALVEPERRRREVYEDEKIRQRARLGIGL